MNKEIDPADAGGGGNKAVSKKIAWSRPALLRIRPGSAEAGANPANPEGLFDGS